MSPKPPDFIIAGAPRSGTTLLYELLDRHPEVYMAKPARPEPKFFLVDDLYRRGLDYYVDTWFAPNVEGRIAGEKSTNYFESAIAAGRISRELPQVKLIFILREPSERAFSNWLWSRQNGFETADFATALRLEDERGRGLPENYRYARPHAYFSRGLYAELARPFLDAFPRTQLLFLRYEDINAVPRELTVSIHRFLGVTARPGDVEGIGVVNPSKKGVETMPDKVREELKARYAESNALLKRMLGPDFAGWS